MERDVDVEYMYFGPRVIPNARSQSWLDHQKKRFGKCNRRVFRRWQVGIYDRNVRYCLAAIREQSTLNAVNM